jgi:hypothetical protein
MSLNHFTEIEKGVDLKLKIGCQALKTNSVDFSNTVAVVNIGAVIASLDLIGFTGFAFTGVGQSYTINGFTMEVGQVVNLFVTTGATLIIPNVDGVVETNTGAALILPRAPRTGEVGQVVKLPNNVVHVFFQ